MNKYLSNVAMVAIPTCGAAPQPEERLQARVPQAQAGRRGSRTREICSNFTLAHAHSSLLTFWLSHKL